jgi:hypothetical protein
MNYKEIYSNLFKTRLEYNTGQFVSYVYAREFITYLQHKEEITTLADIGSGRGNLFPYISENKIESIHSYDLECFYNINNFSNVNFTKINLSVAEDLSKIKKVDLLCCLDVLEHIEEKFIDEIMSAFSKNSSFCYFSVANHSDCLDGVELHLIQKGLNFWKEKFKPFFEILDVRTFYYGKLMIFCLRSKRGRN